MALILNLLHKAKALYLKPSLYVQVLTAVCVLVLFIFLAYAYHGGAVIEDVTNVSHSFDSATVETTSHTPATSSGNSTAPDRALLCGELQCRMQNPEYVRQYVHKLSAERTAREAAEYTFQRYYVAYQQGPHKREVFMEVERWVRVYPDMPEQHRDTLARVYAELRAQRYRMMFSQSH